ncbi:sirohydrochlorin chelatase [Alicyclobacillus shizuokensis]|uniref:sirohydrochlorin chelatase n=1 Tax=Alicyclobacillus shizuokensis TaxID=392014 RepID=UPI000B0A4B43|nr:sirohydrochlorin chelatase [Alicyclobacillus shizuokensis]
METRAAGVREETGVLLIAHGTRDPEGAAEARQFMEAVRNRLPFQRPWLSIEPAFLELTSPDIGTAVRTLAERRVCRVLVCPLLLFTAGHMRRDIPAQLAAAKQGLQHLAADLRFEVMPAVGVDERFAQVAARRIHDASPAGIHGRGGAAVLLSRGNHDPNAWQDLVTVARRVEEYSGVRPVIPASLTGLGSRLEAALDAAADTGARLITVMPYLWFTGLLSKALPAQVQSWRERHPGIAVHVSRHLGVDDELVRVISERIRTRLLGGGG